MTEERDPAVVRRELRIERAVINLVVHGHRHDTVGYNDALTDLHLSEHATLQEVSGPLLWALSHQPRTVEEPNELLSRLTSLAAVRDADHDD